MRRLKLRIRPKGGLLLGGHDSLGMFADDATARDSDRVPCIPATAITGAIREQASRLVDEVTVERLFGSEGTRDADGQRGAVRIGTARVTDPALRKAFQTGYGIELRQGVSIRRQTRKAADQRLFLREIVAPFVPGLEFVSFAEVRDLDDDAITQFKRFAESVYAIGAGRTAGLGGVEIVVEDVVEDVGPNKETPRAHVDPGWVRIVVTATEPLSLGLDRNEGNHHRTAQLIPAPTLRGAIVTAALARRGVTTQLTKEDVAFNRDVLDPASGLRLTDAICVASGSPETPIPRVAPLTARSCKAECGAQPTDALLDEIVLELATRRAAAAGDRWPDAALQERCPLCNGRLEALSKPYGGTAPRRTVATHVALDRGRGGAEDEKLYSIESLAAETTFVSFARVASADVAAYLEDAAKEGLEVGHGRHRGMGRCTIAFHTEAPSPIADRFAAFAAGLAHRCRRAAITPEPTVVVTALSDIVVPVKGGTRTAHDALIDMIGSHGMPGAVLSRCRVGRAAGWNTIGRAPKEMVGTIRAGSVLAVGLAAPPTAGDFARWTDLEAQGVGERRDEGYGWVRFWDPFHVEMAGASPTKEKR